MAKSNFDGDWAEACASVLVVQEDFRTVYRHQTVQFKKGEEIGPGGLAGHCLAGGCPVKVKNAKKRSANTNQDPNADGEREQDEDSKG